MEKKEEIDYTSKKYLLERIKKLEQKISLLEADNIYLKTRISLLETYKIYPEQPYYPKQPYYPITPQIWCKSEL